MMYKVAIYHKNENRLGLVVLLSGRGQNAEDMLSQYLRFSNLNEFILVAIQPVDEWYPMPQGANKQDEAIAGLKPSVPNLEKFIANFEEEFKIDRSDTVLVGFSAGAVMSIQIAAHTNEAFRGVVSHSGAILEPIRLPHCTHPTRYLVIHNEDDDCFSWEERYLPMKTALLNQGYDLEVLESDIGGHSFFSEDIQKVGLWIKQQFDIPLPEKLEVFE